MHTDMVQEFFDRHQKVALLYSGGKDSLACLYLMRKYLPQVTVLWVNTQAAFPEIVEHMAQVRSFAPKFLEVTSNQPASIKAHGYPTDVLPAQHTTLGQAHTGTKGIRLRTYLDCCRENVWEPMGAAVAKLGFTAVIHGQRLSEAHHSEVRNGDVVNGIEYMMPIQDWTDADVLEFLSNSGLEIDDRLRLGHSSLDCWNCTAYCNNTRDRLQYIKTKHPAKHREVVTLLKEIKEAVTTQISDLDRLLEAA